MRDDTDQVSRGISRQARVAVERDAIPYVRQDGRVANGQHEARVRRAAKQPVEFLDLPALAFPAHPEAFVRVPLTRSVEQEEAVGTAVGMFCVERLDAFCSRVEDLCVDGQVLRLGVLEVTENGEMDVRVEVAERMHFDVRDQSPRALDAVQDRRDDDHRPG